MILILAIAPRIQSDWLVASGWLCNQGVTTSAGLAPATAAMMFPDRNQRASGGQLLLCCIMAKIRLYLPADLKRPHYLSGSASGQKRSPIQLGKECVLQEVNWRAGGDYGKPMKKVQMLAALS